MELAGCPNPSFLFFFSFKTISKMLCLCQKLESVHVCSKGIAKGDMTFMLSFVSSSPRSA